MIMTNDICYDMFEDGSVGYYCLKAKGHKGRHGQREKGTDERSLFISWTNNQNKSENPKP